MIEHAGAGRLAEIQPDVERRAAGTPPSSARSAACVSVMISASSSASSAGQPPDVPVGHDHQVPVVVRKLVEDDERARAAVDRAAAHRRRAPARRRRCSPSDGAARFGHVSEPPGRPEAVNRSAASLSADLLMRSFSSLPGLKYGTCFGGTSTRSPVFGLRPLRGSRRRSRKLPKPAQLDLLAAVQRVDDALEDGVDDDLRVLLREVRDARDFFDQLGFGHLGSEGLRPCGLPTRSLAGAPMPRSVRATRSPSSLVTRPWSALLQMLEVVPERHFGPAGRLGVGLPVGAVAVVLQRPDAQADLPLLRASAG